MLASPVCQVLHKKEQKVSFPEGDISQNHMNDFHIRRDRQSAQK